MAQDMDKKGTKIRILRAAKKEFASNGFAGARMDSIAKTAKANKAMIHYYFDTKEKLYREVLFFVVGRTQTEQLPLGVPDVDVSPSESLASSIYFIVSMHYDCFDPEFHRMMAWDMAEGNHHGRVLIQEVFAPAMERLESVIIEGVKSGEFETENPIFEVWTIISSIVHYMRSRDLFKGSPMQKKLYPENGKNVLIDYLTNHVFKSLAPRSVTLPKIPENVKNLLDHELQNLKKNYCEAI
ncbi:MAG: TetR/AcrR family transcriptional regulator [Leptospirales bacterium]